MLGKRLVHLRKKQKLPQKIVAEDLGIARSTYSNYENNIRLPDYNMLLRIADYFQVSTDFLLGREDRTNKTLTSENLAKALETLTYASDLNEADHQFIAEHLEKFIAYAREKKTGNQ